MFDYFKRLKKKDEEIEYWKKKSYEAQEALRIAVAEIKRLEEENILLDHSQWVKPLGNICNPSFYKDRE